MPFIRNIKQDQQVVSFFNNEVSLEFGETTRISASRLASSEVQNAISAGSIKEVPSFTFLEGNIKGTWDMGASTALPPGSQPGFIYEVITPAVHPTSGDSFGPGDLAIINTDGILVRNLTASLNSGGGGSGQYTWVSVSSNYNVNANEYVLANSLVASFVIVLPASPNLGDTVGVYPSTASFSINPVTIIRNTNNIQGQSEDLLMNENIGITLIFVGGTVGWLLLPLDDTVVFIQDLQADSYYTIDNVVGTSYTLLPSDSGKFKVFNTADPVDITLPQFSSQILPPGFYVSFRNKLGGPITLVLQGTDILSGAGATTNNSLRANSVYLEESGVPNLWVSVGDMS